MTRNDLRSSETGLCRPSFAMAQPGRGIKSLVDEEARTAPGVRMQNLEIKYKKPTAFALAQPAMEQGKGGLSPWADRARYRLTRRFFTIPARLIFLEPIKKSNVTERCPQGGLNLWRLWGLGPHRGVRMQNLEIKYQKPTAYAIGHASLEQGKGGLNPCAARGHNRAVGTRAYPQSSKTFFCPTERSLVIISAPRGIADGRAAPR
jgi:hypothetical protein